jgi:hypothetical protein
MGPDERARHDAEADAFFAKFINPSIDLIAEVGAERYGDLETVTAEDKAYGFWARKMAARAERRAIRELADTRARQMQQDRLDAIPTVAPKAPIPADGQPPVVLPKPRIVVLTDQERTETAKWWSRLANNQGAGTLRARIRGEIRDAAADDRFAARANAAWRNEQRAFERAQWQDVTNSGRKRRKVAARWVAITEDRALAIALAALDNQHPPQGRK